MPFWIWKWMVRFEMFRDGWTVGAIASTDWSAWKEFNFDAGQSPREALNEEYAAGQ